MLRRNLWKIIFSLALALWAVTTILPLKDQPFTEYAQSHVTAKQPEFDKLLGEAQARRSAGQAPSDFVALKQIASERKIDLSQYYPDIRLEQSLVNIEKRNSILLNELLRRSKSPLQLGLDLKGGVGFTLEVDEAAAGNEDEYAREAKLKKAIEIIETRINAFGVAEPILRPVGNNRIEVQIPNINTRDNPEIVDNVKKPARLDFRIVYPQSGPMQVEPTDVPPGYEVMSVDEDDARTKQSYTTYYLVKRLPEMTGKNIEQAGVTTDQYGNFEVILRFNDDGSKEFAKVTGENKGNLMAIVLDGRLYSAPRINQAITGGSASITGRFSQREAEQLAGVLNNPLDLPLVVKEQYEVGPSLAEDAITSGTKAAVIGTALVAAFMIVFYSAGGLVSVITLALNVLIIFGVMASIGATLTLPGLAGIVLTIGMAVDANILIFERMREEIAEGKNLRTANQSGFLKALSTILDAHLVQLIICGVMIGLGSGPIKGFGVTLAIGVVSTLFSVLITAHMIMEWLVESDTLKRMTMRRMMKTIHVDFIKYGKAAFIGSWIVVLMGVGVVVYKGSAIYGIDFAGGDVISLQFKERVDTGKIRQIAQSANLGEVNPTYVSAIGGATETLKIETVEGKSEAVLAALKQAYPAANYVVVGSNHIGASIGKEIEYNALLAVGVSMLVILVYIAFRFEFGFGVGAMFSSLHDILMTIGIFVLFGNQFSAPMVAAILAIAGYSINETVVVFDRIREELKVNPTGSLREVVNTAISKVFARTIMTATTTFLAALSLFIFGSGVLKDIAFTFLVGIVTATFSAIFISSQVFYWWHKGDRKHVEAHEDVAPKYEWTGSSKASE